MIQDFEKIKKGCSERNRACQKELYKMYYSYGMCISIRFAQNENEAIKILNDSFIKVFSNISKCKSEADFMLRLKKRIELTAANRQRKKKIFSLFLPKNVLKRVVLSDGLIN